MSDKTTDWNLFEAGKRYNNSLSPSYYDTVDANIAFFNGDQWRNLETEKLPKPVFNIIKRVIQFQVASLTTSNIKMQYTEMLRDDLNPKQEVEDAILVANNSAKNLFEKWKMEYKVKDALTDGATMGDYCAHLYFDITKQPFGANSPYKGEINLELVDGTNVYFGNANTTDVQSQPYIIISGRDMVSNLKEEAKRYKTKEQEINNITDDAHYEEQAGDAGQIEVEADEHGKALYIIVYRKNKNGTVTATKSTETAYIYKDVDMGLHYYPIAWGGWEQQKNQYHHRALCTGMLPNQIFINRAFAMVMYHLQMTAFPKALYNKDVIANWNNKIGAAIGVEGFGPDVNVKNVAGYLEPASMSNQITDVIDMAMQYTKDTLGVSDAALGEVDPKNTSAIIAVQKASAVPLENPKANLYEWLEDIGRIALDMMGTYYGLRPVSVEQDGQRTVVEYDFSQFKNLALNVKVDIGEGSYWSEISSIQTLDNLLSNEKIEFIDYLKRVPDEYIPQKEELISKIEDQMQMANDPQNLIAQLTPEEQQQFMNAPPEVQQQIMAELQGGMM